MKIKGELYEYEVDWRACGWSYARVIIKRGEYLFGFIPYLKTVWDSSGKSTMSRIKLKNSIPKN